MSYLLVSTVMVAILSKGKPKSDPRICWVVKGYLHVAPDE